VDRPLPAAIEYLERAMVAKALEQAGGRLESAADLLGISRKGLYLKRQRLGIEPEYH
jgi:DNA-binding NtrC family response regulator